MALAYSRRDILGMLTDIEADELFSMAYQVKVEHVGKVVSLRGLVECSNVCVKNCFYCGIRCGNTSITRYRMTEDDMVESARWAAKSGYGSVVFQSGEVVSKEYAALIERVLGRLHGEFGDELGITLSLGEQTEETYRRWKDAGAHRYLIRIETSNRELYARLHPADHSWESRLECLRTLRRLGYITGSGVIIGVPGQTVDDLVSDIEFFAAEDLDMIGMGPFIPHPDTPLGAGISMTPDWKRAQVELGLRMIAAVRLCLRDVNIASTTALQALDPQGRERGLLAGANVVMPNVTPLKYRGDYRLYADKPCVFEDAEDSRDHLDEAVRSIGERIGWNVRGDSVHWCRRQA